VSRAALVGVLLLSACSSFSDLRSTPASPVSTIRVLTINVWSGLDYQGTLTMGRHEQDPEARYRALVKGIADLDPDVIAIQEANPLPDYAARLAGDLDYQYAAHVGLGGIRCGPVGIPTNLREGGAVLAKRAWPLEDLDRERLLGKGIISDWFCFQLEETTQAILARIRVGATPVYVYAVHLHACPSGCDQRPEEVAALRRFIERSLPEGVPAVVLGDFNTTVESGELAPLLDGLGMVDSFGHVHPDQPGSTWDPAANPHISGDASEPARIDLILVGGSIRPADIVSSEVVLRGEGGLPPSDHFGVLTTVRMGSRQGR
jgi:endonuclease/exonuclease/phosphatase family metal-dependent hydrolase